MRLLEGFISDLSTYKYYDKYSMYISAYNGNFRTINISKKSTDVSGDTLHIEFIL